jgi:hypothetical protein
LPPVRDKFGGQIRAETEHAFFILLPHVIHKSMSKSSKDETSSQASARQSKLTVSLGLVFDSPEGKIGPLIKRFKEQAQGEQSLKNEIAKVGLSKHRLAKLGGALIKV